MKPFFNINGSLRYAKGFDQTFAALKARTWLEKNGIMYGFKKAPSQALLRRNNNILSICPWDYTLNFLNDTEVNLRSRQTAWKIMFDSTEEIATAMNQLKKCHEH